MGHQSYVLLCTETTVSNPPVDIGKIECSVHLYSSPWSRLDAFCVPMRFTLKKIWGDSYPGAKGLDLLDICRFYPQGGSFIYTLENSSSLENFFCLFSLKRLVKVQIGKPYSPQEKIHIGKSSGPQLQSVYIFMYQNYPDKHTLPRIRI